MILNETAEQKKTWSGIRSYLILKWRTRNWEEGKAIKWKEKEKAEKAAKVFLWVNPEERKKRKRKKESKKKLLEAGDVSQAARSGTHLMSQ